MSVSLDDLASPADADYFRMTVDYGRWYVDPLPACDIAPATEKRWPSCSAVKKASEKDWSFLVIPRIAALDADELHRIAGLDNTQRVDAFKSHEKYAKNVAFGRGSIVHLWKEDLLAGREPRQITDGWLTVNKYPTAARDEAAIYLPAILDFFQTYQPEPVAVEYVTIHRTLNGHGYGATPDALARIEGEIVALDWKTRGAGSNHAAYAEELAQVACGARAEYMVVRGDGVAQRQKIPPVAGGYVVSIKPDGARLYPLDIDKGWQHWCRLHEWWVHRLTEKDGVGRVLPKRSARKANSDEALPSEISAGGELSADRGQTNGDVGATGLVDTVPPPAEPLDTLRARYHLLNDTEQAAFRALNIDPTDAEAIKAGLDEVDGFAKPPALTPRAADPDPRPVVNTAPDEGAEVNETDVAALKKRYSELTPEAKAWTGAVVAQGNDGHSWRINEGTPTVRRYEIYRGVLALAEWSDGKADDVIRAIVALIAGTTTIQNTTQPGVALGLLDADGAARFAAIAGDVTADKFALAYSEDGTPTLNAA